tara:strand:+ start:584 stop:1435 length:852 start_codon:yes stop_codon:yes gene_type:complete
MNKEVTVIILCHKSKNLVINYIKSIYNKFEIIIIDNSNDIELTRIIKENYLGVLIKNIDNNGYGAAINYGSKFVKTKYFLISNPDLSGINENSLNEFVDTAKFLKDKFSALGPRYLNANPKSLKQSQSNKDIAELRFLSGACMFFNKKNYDLIGGFDNNIFLYFEENDYCERSKKFFNNYQINNIKVFHEPGNSVLCENQNQFQDQQELRSWHFIWSKFYYYKKNYGYMYTIFFFLPIIFRTGFKIVLYLIIKDEINYFKYKNRWSGMISSIKGEKSYKRPKF